MTPQLDRAIHLLETMMPTEPGATVHDLRAAYARWCEQFPLAPDVIVDEVSAAGVPALWVTTRASDPARTVVHLHGGAYAVGSARGHREMTSRIARATRARVLVLDYPLAPEHPFPAAIDAVTAAYRWLLDQGTRPSQTAMCGESAGGGLTVATLVALRDHKVPLPAAAIVMSPWVDLECASESMHRITDDPFVRRDNLISSAADYLAGTPTSHPLASPFNADLTDLPPLLVQVGSREILLDDSLRLAARARMAGVDVTLSVIDGMPHLWQHFGSFLPEARDAIDQIGVHFRRYLRLPSMT